MEEEATSKSHLVRQLPLIIGDILIYYFFVHFSGTHGHMKCVFDGNLKAQDTVLMNLYKRIFPKWTYDVTLPRPLAWTGSSEVGGQADTETMQQ